MPPKAKDAPESPNDGPNSDKPQPTSNEAYLFFTLIKNMRGRPDIDWEQVAVDNGFKNAETAKVRFGQIKRKLGLKDAAQGAPPTPRAPRGGGRAKKGATAASPMASSPMAAQMGSGPTDDSEFVADVLGPSPSGIKKEKAPRNKRNARPKTEDFASGDGFVTPTKTKKAPRKTAVKNEEDSDVDGQTMLPPAHVVDEDGEGPMEMDEETNLGRITPSATRSVKPDPEHDVDNLALNATSGPMPGQNVLTHPMYISSTLAPIPRTRTTGAVQQLQNNYVSAQGGSNGYGFHPTIQAGPIRGRSWEEDDEGAIAQLRMEAALENNKGKDRNTPAQSQPKPAANASFHQQVNLSSMMAGGLPGGASSGSYRTPQATQIQDQWEMSVPNGYGNTSIFGDGSGNRNRSHTVDDYDNIGPL